MKRGWEEGHAIPHLWNETHFVSYDDEESLETKVAYAMEKGLAGVMIWSLDNDDVHGACGPPYPLLRTVHRALRLRPPPPASAARLPEVPLTGLLLLLASHRCLFRAFCDVASAT